MSINSTGNTYLSESFSYDDEGDLKYSATMPARGVPVLYLQDHIKKMQENNLFVRDYNVSTVYYNHAGSRCTRTVSTGPYQEDAGKQPLRQGL